MLITREKPIIQGKAPAGTANDWDLPFLPGSQGRLISTGDNSLDSAPLPDTGTHRISIGCTRANVLSIGSAGLHSVLVILWTHPETCAQCCGSEGQNTPSDAHTHTQALTSSSPGDVGAGQECKRAARTSGRAWLQTHGCRQLTGKHRETAAYVRQTPGFKR